MPSGNPGVALQHDDVIERKKVDNLKTKFLTTLIHIKKTFLAFKFYRKCSQIQLILNYIKSITYNICMYMQVQRYLLKTTWRVLENHMYICIKFSVFNVT
jgi:hypothetical protein